MHRWEEPNSPLLPGEREDDPAMYSTSLAPAGPEPEEYLQDSDSAHPHSLACTWEQLWSVCWLCLPVDGSTECVGWRDLAAALAEESDSWQGWGAVGGGNTALLTIQHWVVRCEVYEALLPVLSTALPSMHRVKHGKVVRGAAQSKGVIKSGQSLPTCPVPLLSAFLCRQRRILTWQLSSSSVSEHHPSFTLSSVLRTHFCPAHTFVFV